MRTTRQQLVLIVVILAGHLGASESTTKIPATATTTTTSSPSVSTTTIIPTTTTITSTTTTTSTTTATTSLSNCECNLRSLRELESLEKSWRRLRIENPNGFTKYPTTNGSLVVGCHTLAVYEKTVYFGT